MAFNRYGIYCANFAGPLLRDVTSMGFQSNSKKSLVIPGGLVNPQSIVLCCADPVWMLQTRALATLFGPLSFTSGYPIIPDTTSPAIMQFQQRDTGGTFKGSGNYHVTGTSESGVLFLESIMAAQDDEKGAMANLRYVFLSVDGFTQPIEFDVAATLPTTPTYQDIWYMGRVRVGQIGSSLTNFVGTVKVELRSGIDFRSPRADGAVYPVNGSIHTTFNEMRITSLDLNARNFMLNTPWHNGFVAGAAFNVYLQKGIHGGARVADNVAEHIVVTAAAGDWTTESLQVQETDDCQAEILVRPKTNNFTVTANTTIG